MRTPTLAGLLDDEAFPVGGIGTLDVCKQFRDFREQAQLVGFEVEEPVRFVFDNLVSY
jgi:hypothetical protein